MGADRTRRVLGMLGLLSLCALQALWPHPSVEAWGRWLTQPLGMGLRPLAGWFLGPSVHAAGPTRALLPSIAELERRLGSPPSVAGVAWLEAPVLSRAEVDFQISGGLAQGFFPGLPVVFGGSYLGRLETVEEDRSWVVLASAADRRTGLALVGEDGGALSALAIGRGRHQSPVIAYIGPRTDPVPDAPALWRPRQEDPPGLARAGFEVGWLRELGDLARGDFHRILDLRLPLGAGGRVWVAVGAVPANLPRVSRANRGPARPVLRRDAVFGDAVACAIAASKYPWGAVLAQNRVAGLVIAQEGRQLWVLRPGPVLRAEGLAWDPDSQRLLDPADAGEHALHYTSRWESAPRGLPLGTLAEAPVAWVEPMQVVAE